MSRRLHDIARQARVPIASVDELPRGDGRLTALVTGAGRSRRIFISSELIRDWSDDEVAVVVAHELGHHAHHDLWRTLALDALLLSLALWLADGLLAGAPGAMLAAGRAQPVWFPATWPRCRSSPLSPAAVWLATTPLRHAHSRAQERRADRFALAVTGGADAFTAAIRRLGAQHLSEERPSSMTQWLYHRHPTVAERAGHRQWLRRCSEADWATHRQVLTNGLRALPVCRLLLASTTSLRPHLPLTARDRSSELQPISNVPDWVGAEVGT